MQPFPHHTALQETANSLGSSSASFLVDETPLISSSHHLPEYTPIVISPMRKRRYELLSDPEEPHGKMEQAYQAALKQSYDQIGAYKKALIGTQATVVLQGMFVNRLSGQLQAQENTKKKQKGGKINGDGQPKLLTSKDFRLLVDKRVEAGERDQTKRESRQKQREAQNKLMATWKEADEARKYRNKERREAYQEEMQLWVEENESAKLEKRRVSWAKPKQGKQERQLPKPWIRSENSGSANEAYAGKEDENDEGEHSDDNGSDDE